MSFHPSSPPPPPQPPPSTFFRHQLFFNFLKKLKKVLFLIFQLFNFDSRDCHWASSSCHCSLRIFRSLLLLPQLFFNFFQLEKVEKSWKVEKVEKSRKSLLLFSHSLLYYWVNDEWLKNTIHLLNHVFSSFVSTSVAASACMLSSKNVCEKNWKKSPPSSTVTISGDSLFSAHGH